MPKLEYLKNILSVLDLDTAITKYRDVLRYLILIVQRDGFKEGKLATYLASKYPKLTQNDSQYLVQLVGKNYKNKYFLDRIFNPNTSSSEKTIIDSNYLNKILSALHINFDGLLKSPDRKDSFLKALTEAVLELEKTVQACSEGLDNNKLIEFK